MASPHRLVDAGIADSVRTAMRPVLRGAVANPVLAARVVLDRVGENPTRFGLRESPLRARARALAEAGELSAAVALLPPGERLRRRYEGELNVLAGRIECELTRLDHARARYHEERPIEPDLETAQLHQAMFCNGSACAGSRIWERGEPAFASAASTNALKSG